MTQSEIAAIHACAGPVYDNTTHTMSVEWDDAALARVVEGIRAEAATRLAQWRAHADHFVDAAAEGLSVRIVTDYAPTPMQAAADGFAESYAAGQRAAIAAPPDLAEGAALMVEADHAIVYGADEPALSLLVARLAVEVTRLGDTCEVLQQMHEAALENAARDLHARDDEIAGLRKDVRILRVQDNNAHFLYRRDADALRAERDAARRVCREVAEDMDAQSAAAGYITLGRWAQRLRDVAGRTA